MSFELPVSVTSLHLLRQPTNFEEPSAALYTSRQFLFSVFLATKAVEPAGIVGGSSLLATPDITNNSIGRSIAVLPIFQKLFMFIASPWCDARGTLCCLVRIDPSKLSYKIHFSPTIQRSIKSKGTLIRLSNHAFWKVMAITNHSPNRTRRRTLGLWGIGCMTTSNDSPN